MRTLPEQQTDFVKHWLWDLGTNLLGYAEWVHCREFPADEVLRGLHTWRRYLDMIIDHAEQVRHEDSRPVVNRGEFFPVGGSTRGVEAVVAGLRNAWFADQTQQYLDAEIAEARRRWREE